MLYKNHEKVTLVKEDIYQANKDEFDSLIKGKKTVTFRTQDPIRVNKTGYTEYDRIQTVPTEVVTPSPNGYDEDTWNYCQHAPRIKQNGEKEYDRKPILIKRVVTVPTSEKDKIFFLLYISKAGLNGRISIVDEAKDADKKVLDLARKSELDYLLTGSMSPLTPKDKRRIAKSFGISDTDNKSDSQVILAIKSMVDLAEKNHDSDKNTNAFLKAIQEDEITSTKAIIQEAIDKKKVIFDEIQSSYSYADTSGKPIKKIVDIDLVFRDSTIKRLNALYTYFKSDKEKERELLRLLGYADVDNIDFSKYLFMGLKKFAAAHDVKLKNTHKEEEIVEILTEWFENNKNKRPIDLSILHVNLKEKQ